LSDPGVGSTAAVVIDTNVFSWVYAAPRNTERTKEWLTRLAGRTVVLAVQTEVEIRSGPRLAGWSASRTDALMKQLEGKITIPVDDKVQEKYVDLTVWSKSAAHPIFQPVHSSDRWIAATALAYDLDLASGDFIFQNIAELRLLTL